MTVVRYRHMCYIVWLGSSVVSISNNGLLVRAITDILFYIDLIGTMVEINKILIIQDIV